MKLAVLDLRPTQFVLGMREVDFKIKKIADLKADGEHELNEWIEEHAVPVVIGPGDHHYLIDHHHFAAACYHSGIGKVNIHIEAEQRSLAPAAFWAYLKAQQWVYLYDQFGHGPHEPTRLPLDIRGLSDDPYRSLAWELRRAGVIAKVQKPFAEFAWATWLRTRLPFDLHHETWDSVVKKAIALATDRLAQERRS